MKYLVLALLFIATPVHGAIVKVAEGIYVDMPVITQAEVDQMTDEKQAEINNMTVEFNRAIAQKQLELAGLTFTPTVDATIYDTTIYGE